MVGWTTKVTGKVLQALDTRRKLPRATTLVERWCAHLRDDPTHIQRGLPSNCQSSQATLARTERMHEQCSVAQSCELQAFPVSGRASLKIKEGGVGAQTWRDAISRWLCFVF